MLGGKINDRRFNQLRFWQFLKEQYTQKKYNKDFNHSIEGRLTRMYHRMKERGNSNLPFSKEEFVAYGKKSDKMKKLFSVWKKSGYEYKKTPTVDRKDYNKGYTLDNIQFLSFEENRDKQDKEYD